MSVNRWNGIDSVPDEIGFYVTYEDYVTLETQLEEEERAAMRHADYMAKLEAQLAEAEQKVSDLEAQCTSGYIVCSATVDDMAERIAAAVGILTAPSEYEASESEGGVDGVQRQQDRRAEREEG